MEQRAYHKRRKIGPEPVWNWNHDRTWLFVSHARLSRENIRDLRSVQMLILWSVDFEDPDLLQDLPDLWWLGLRGGRDPNHDWIGALPLLKFVEMWHAYGVQSVDFLARLPNLQGFHLHALPKVSQLPSLATCPVLRFAELGRLKSLASLAGLADAPNLTALFISGKIDATDADLRALCDHPSLDFVTVMAEASAAFYERWQAGVSKPRTRYTFREEWQFEGLTPSQMRTLEGVRSVLRRTSAPPVLGHNS